MHFSIILLLVCSAVSGVAAFKAPFARRILAQQQSKGLSTAVYAKKDDDEVIPENETDEEMMERLRRKAKKRMYNENGVAFAPWMTRQVDIDAMAQLMYNDEKGIKKNKPKTTTLDRGEIDTADGLKYRMVGNQVEIGWVTSGEADNQGFIVEKRPSYGGDFMEVASYNEVGGLQTKGPEGGRYRYLDPSTSMGSWIYRVKDCDLSGNQNILCQAFVEVQTEQESKSQAVIAVGFVAALLAFFAVGYSLDPPI